MRRRPRVLRRGMAAQKLETDVLGVKMVELVARSEATVNERLPVSWADAAFLRPMGTATLPQE